MFAVVHPWLRKLHHDLVKPLLWPARDCQDLGQLPAPGELRQTLFDNEGNPIDAILLWRQLKEDAPADTDADDFEAALQLALAAACADNLAGVLALELAYESLKQRFCPEAGNLASTLNGEDT